MSFVIGTKWYKRRTKQENIFNIVVGVIYHALKNRSFFTIKRAHWLDHYLDSHNCAVDEQCVAASHNKKQPEVCTKVSRVRCSVITNFRKNWFTTSSPSSASQS